MAYFVKLEKLKIGKKNHKEILLYLKNEILKNISSSQQKKNLDFFFKIVENFGIEFEEKFLALNFMKNTIENENQNF